MVPVRSRLMGRTAYGSRRCSRRRSKSSLDVDSDRSSGPVHRFHPGPLFMCGSICEVVSGSRVRRSTNGPDEAGVADRVPAARHVLRQAPEKSLGHHRSACTATFLQGITFKQFAPCCFVQLPGVDESKQGYDQPDEHSDHDATQPLAERNPGACEDADTNSSECPSLRGARHRPILAPLQFVSSGLLAWSSRLSEVQEPLLEPSQEGPGGGWREG